MIRNMGNMKKLSKHAMRKLERPVAASHAVQNGKLGRAWHHEGGCEAGNCIPKDSQKDIWLLVESHESTRQRVESSLLTKHEDRCGKASTSMTHHNLVHNFILVPQAMKILDAKAAVDKEWQRLGAIPAWKLEKVKGKEENILEAQRDEKKVHFAALMDMCHLKNAELEPKC